MMPKYRLLEEHLTDKMLQAKGRFLVVQLTRDHKQRYCATVPKGTRGIITASRIAEEEHVFLFPHSILKDPRFAFSDGEIRIIRTNEFKPLGRISRR